MRDVDDEGYHVAMAHPALQDLYGRRYRDITYPNGLSHSLAEFGDQPGRRWSVRAYLRHHEPQEYDQLRRVLLVLRLADADRPNNFATRR